VPPQNSTSVFQTVVKITWKLQQMRQHVQQTYMYWLRTDLVPSFFGTVRYSSDCDDDVCSNHSDDSVSHVSDSDSEDSVVIPVYRRIQMHLKGSTDVVVNPAPKVYSLSARQENELINDDNNAEAVETVKLSLTTRGGRRKWDKRDFCKFCQKPQSKLIRHMMLKHRNEVEVEDFIAMPLKSKRRHLMQRKLRNDGNYMHNVSVLKDQSGEIIPFRRPSVSQHSSDDFIPCESCHAMFVKDNLWRHRKKCPFKQSHSGHSRCQGFGSILLPFSSAASEGLKRDIMTGLNQDDVASVVRTDDVIMKFASRLHFQHSHAKHRFPYIKERIRQMGRFLLQMRSMTSVKCLSDCLDPTMFESVVSAVRCICGFDVDMKLTYLRP